MQSTRSILAGFCAFWLGGALLVGTAAAGGERTEWDQLLADYRSYELSMPPASAPLVLVVERAPRVDGEERPPLRHLGFVLGEGKGRSSHTVLIGTEVVRIEQPEVTPSKRRPREVTAVDPRPEMTTGMTAAWEDPVFHVNSGVATAIQCRDRGWNDLAEALLTASLKVSVGENNSMFKQRRGAPAREMLARVAMAHWANALLRPETDRAEILRWLEALLRRVPEVRDFTHDNLLLALRETVAPRKSVPGSVESCIDDLVDVTYRHHQDDRGDPRYRRVAMLGFRAVPALLRHLEDDRLTRTVTHGLNNLATYHTPVRELVDLRLWEIAGPDFPEDDWDPRYGPSPEPAAILAWWLKARKEGEESYVLRRALPTAPGDTLPRKPMLRILADRYPRHLPRLYRRILREGLVIESWPVADAIAVSRLTVAQKRALLQEGAANRDPGHRRGALRNLKLVNARPHR